MESAESVVMPRQLDRASPHVIMSHYRQGEENAMKVIAEVVTLFVGVIVWRVLSPHIGLGGLLVAAIVAYVLRPIVYAVLGASASEPGSESSNEVKQIEKRDNDL